VRNSKIGRCSICGRSVRKADINKSVIIVNDQYFCIFHHGILNSKNFKSLNNPLIGTCETLQIDSIDLMSISIEIQYFKNVLKVLNLEVLRW